MGKAIKIAIENGYEYHDLPGDLSKEDYGRIITSSPLFWSSLGKGLKWEEKLINQDNIEFFLPEWKYQWHLFIDHLIEGKDIESFFIQIINEKYL